MKHRRPTAGTKGPQRAHGVKPPSMSPQFTFRELCLAVPAGYELVEQSDFQVILSGPYNDSVFTELEREFLKADLRIVIEYWGGQARLRMPSGLPSERNVVDEGRIYWQDRNPVKRSDLTAFGSSATFLFEGAVSSGGEPRRFVPDSSLSKLSRYFSEVSKDFPRRTLTKGYFPDKVVEVRSPGNPRGELEERQR
jgi:hypothetical protein